MRNFFLFLWKYHFFILFVILEVISLSLLFNSYSYHKSLSFNTVSDISGNMFNNYSNMSNYFSLAEENQKLNDENARLREQLSSSFLYSDTSIIYVDSLYGYIPASVVNNSVSKNNDFFMLNKGEKHGVHKEMGVVSSSGLAGIVIGTSENYALAMSMLHPNSRISGRIKKSGQLVNVIWKGFDYKTGYVIDIPTHVELSAGDSVITSGNSLIFPEGIMIGVIVEQESYTGKALGEATLNFSTDFNALRHVHLIENKMREEQLELESIKEDE